MVVPWFAELVKEGPAANSGIEVGDIVIAIEGIEITSAKAFYDEIALYDTSVELLIRDKDNASMESYVFIDLLEKGTTQRPKPKPTLSLNRHLSLNRLLSLNQFLSFLNIPILRLAGMLVTVLF